MKKNNLERSARLSIIIPCFNEQKTLKKCVNRVLEIKDDSLSLEIIIVDDCSVDNSLQIAQQLANRHSEIIIMRHNRNQGKGAALRTGFQKATGEFVVIQDADLEYNPIDIKRLLIPLINNEADVVFGSRFLTGEAHRVLYFWHYAGNKFLTLLSNMFSDLNLTDIECCYKIFRRKIIERITIEEDRFGVEPELVAKVAQMRPRIFEIGISYSGRTYAEGKKIGFRDGIRALYCIFHYNAHKASLPIQFLIYLFVGGLSAFVNISIFLLFQSVGSNSSITIPMAHLFSAIIDYFLCIALLFRHNARWNTATEILIYILVVGLVGIFDFWGTLLLMAKGISPWLSKSVVSMIGLIFNFFGRRYFVFPESPTGQWQTQLDSSLKDIC